MTDWYQRQRERDDAARAKSHAVLGPEGAAFAEAMGLLSACLEAAFASGADDLATRRKIEFASHAFNLLWSAWDETLCGRYDASGGHSRSVNESTEFLWALYARPALAEQLGRSHNDINTARKAIRDALNDHDAPRGTDFHTRTTQAAKALDLLAHLTHQAAGRGLSVMHNEQGFLWVLRPGGAVTEPSLREQAISLARYSLCLLAIAVTAFDDVVPVARDPWSQTMERIGAWAQVLDSEERSVASYREAAMGRIYLARQGEELDAVW